MNMKETLLSIPGITLVGPDWYYYQILLWGEVIGTLEDGGTEVRIGGRKYYNTVPTAVLAVIVADKLVTMQSTMDALIAHGLCD